MAKELSDFGKAFAAARKTQGAGGTFEYKGKKYSTRRADDEDVAVSASKKNYKSDAKADADDADTIKRLAGRSLGPRVMGPSIEAEEPELGRTRRPTFKESRERPTNIRMFGSSNRESMRANMPTGRLPLPPLPKGMKKGGAMKESKMMVKKEIEFFKKKGAPKSMIKHEEKEAKGKTVKKYARGGGIESKGKTRGKFV